MTYSASALFNKTLIKQAIMSLQPKFSSAVNIFSKRTIDNPETIYAWEAITNSLRTVPVISKGTASIPIGSESSTITYIEPQPIEVSTFISAADLNKIKTYSNKQLADWRTQRIQDIRDLVFNTRNSIATLCFNGVLTWPIKVNGGLKDNYTITFGTVATVAAGIAGNWGAGATKLSTITKDINIILEAQKDAGYGDQPVFYCGRDVFAALSDKISSVTNQAFDANFNTMVINFQGLKFVNDQFRYWSHSLTGTEATARLIGDTEIRVVDMAADFRTINMPVDDIDDLNPNPLAIKPVMTEDPSGIKLIGRSCPIYIPVIDSIKKATVA